MSTLDMVVDERSESEPEADRAVEDASEQPLATDSAETAEAGDGAGARGKSGDTRRGGAAYHQCRRRVISPALAQQAGR
jgi:hypothetical protein